MDLLSDISLLAQALTAQGNGEKSTHMQQHVLLAGRQQTPGRNSRYSHREQRTAVRQQQRPSQQWQSQDPTGPIDALLLAAGTLAEAEEAAPGPPARDAKQHIAAQQGPDLDEIATQIVSAFPDFAELLHNQLQPAAAPQEPQLDAAQQALLQQLILGVTQQQEQEEAQQRQRLSTAGSRQQYGQYAMQQQQEEAPLIQNKQDELQQQQLEALQRQMLFMRHQHTAGPDDGNILSSELLATTAVSNGRGVVNRGYAVNGRTNNSRPPLQVPWSNGRRQSPVHKSAAAAAGYLAGLDAAAAAALPVPGMQQQRRPWGRAGQRKQQKQQPQQQANSTSGNGDIYMGVSDWDDELQHEHTRKSQQKKKSQQQQPLQCRVAQGSDSGGASTPHSSSAQDSPVESQEQDDADVTAAAAVAPLSRRALLGLPPVGPGPKQQWVAAQAATAAMQLQIVRQKPTKSHHVVFVWDLDESLVLLHSLITGRFAAAVGAADAGQLADLGRQMQALVMKLIDDKMHFKQLEDVDLVHLSDVWRLAAQDKHRRGARNKQQHQDKAGEQQQQGQDDRLQNAVAGTSDGAEEQQQQAAHVKNDAMDVDAVAASEGSQAADDGTVHASSGSKAGSAADDGSSSSSSLDGTAADGGVNMDKQNTAASGEAAAAVTAIACSVAGSPSAAPEAELVLPPFKVGPRPDMLKDIWDDIHKVYDAGSGVLPLSKADVCAADVLWEELDAATGGWLTAARQLLAELSACRDLLVTHVMVGNSQLVPLLGKLMLFKLDTVFGITEVYSASTATKLACFKRIADKYGPKARYVVVGDGLEEEACAEHMGWPFVRITLAQQPPPQHGASSAHDVNGVQPAGTTLRGQCIQAANGSTGSSEGAEAVPKRLRLVSSSAGSSAAAVSGGGDGEGGGSAGGSDSAAADNIGKQEHGPVVHGTTGTADGAAAAVGRLSSDESESPKSPQHQAQEAARQRPGSSGSCQEALHVRVDALGSGGHRLLELTAQQLVKLALSVK